MTSEPVARELERRCQAAFARARLQDHCRSCADWFEGQSLRNFDQGRTYFALTERSAREAEK
jgi:hypothetical protein